MSEWRQKNATRGDIFVALVFVGLVFAALLAGALLFEQGQRDTGDERVGRAAALQTLRGGQRGNELRRALVSIEDEFARDCTLCRKALLNLDPDAKVEDNCRSTVITITGIDLGSESGGPPPNPNNFVTP